MEASVKDYAKVRMYYLKRRSEDIAVEIEGLNEKRKRILHLGKQVGRYISAFDRTMKPSDAELRLGTKNEEVFRKTFPFSKSWGPRGLETPQEWTKGFGGPSCLGFDHLIYTMQESQPSSEKQCASVEKLKCVKDPVLRKLLFMPIHLSQAERFKGLAEKIFSRTCIKKEYEEFLYENPYVLIALDSQSVRDYPNYFGQRERPPGVSSLGNP